MTNQSAYTPPQVTQLSKPAQEAGVVQNNAVVKKTTKRKAPKKKSREIRQIPGANDGSIVIFCAHGCGISYTTYPRTVNGPHWHKTLRKLNAHEAQRCPRNHQRKRCCRKTNKIRASSTANEPQFIAHDIKQEAPMIHASSTGVCMPANPFKGVAIPGQSTNTRKQRRPSLTTITTSITTGTGLPRRSSLTLSDGFTAPSIVALGLRPQHDSLGRRQDHGLTITPTGSKPSSRRSSWSSTNGLDFNLLDKMSLSSAAAWSLTTLSLGQHSSSTNGNPTHQEVSSFDWSRMSSLGDRVTGGCSWSRTSSLNDASAASKPSALDFSHWDDSHESTLDLVETPRTPSAGVLQAFEVH